MPHVVRQAVDLAALRLSEGWIHKNAEGVGCVIEACDPAAELSIPLDVSGVHTLHLDYFIPAGGRPEAMQLKLSSQSCWRRMRPMRFIRDTGDTIKSVDAITLDVCPGDSLHLRVEPACTVALSGVSLTPATTTEHVDGEKSVAFVHDTCMTLGHYTINQPTDVYAILEPYVGSHVTHIFFGTGVGTYSPLYDSELFGWHGREQTAFMADHRSRAAAAMRLLMAAGKDPLAMAVEYAHANRMQLWANHRISKNHAPDFRDDYPGGRFLIQHRDKLVLEANGEPHPQTLMSHAYPEIRQATVQMLVEQARYGVDGLYIDFLRKPPIVGWERKTVDEFVAKHGFEPRKEKRDDWRGLWYTHLCSYPTELLRELRAALEPIERELGRRMPIAVNIGAGWRFTSGQPLCVVEEGLDPFTWARERLVDIVIPGRDLWLQTECLDRYMDNLADTGCEVWGAVGLKVRETHGGDTDPWRYLQSAHDYYSQGAPGVVLWEAYDIPSVAQVWNTINHRIGSHCELQKTFGNTLGRFDGSDKFWQRSV